MEIEDKSGLIDIQKLLERPTIEELENLGYEKITIEEVDSLISEAELGEKTIEVYLGKKNIRRLKNPRKAALGLTLHEITYGIVKKEHGISNPIVSHSRSLNKSKELGEKEILWGYYGQIYEESPRELMGRLDYSEIKRLFPEKLSDLVDEEP